MANNHRLWTIGALIVCFATAPQPSIAADSPSTPLPATEHFRFTLDPGFLAANPSLGLPQSESAFAGQVRQGRPYRLGRSRSRSVAALTIGTIAAIAGTAVLVYANRPECNNNQSAGGCGYGTKVIGGAVLTGGVAGIVIGALAW
jgi:hypothetical protein